MEKMNKDDILTLCLGYVRQFLADIHINDIAMVVLIYADVIDWEFDYFYDCRNY